MKNSIISIILSGLFVGSSIYLIIARKSNSHLRSELKASRLKSDSLRDARDELYKQVKSLRRYADSVIAKNHSLEGVLAKSRATVATEDKRIIALSRSFEEINKKLDDFWTRQLQWNKDKAEMQSTQMKAHEENKDLVSQVATLSEANRKLAPELAVAKLFEKDNISIMRLDKNGRPNIQARKIKTIKISMSLPSEMKSLALKMFDSNGKLVSDQDGKFITNFSHEANIFGNAAARLELTYSPSKRINSGSYRVEIANDGKHVGNLFMNVR